LILFGLVCHPAPAVPAHHRFLFSLLSHSSPGPRAALLRVVIPRMAWTRTGSVSVPCARRRPFVAAYHAFGSAARPAAAARQAALCADHAVFALALTATVLHCVTRRALLQLAQPCRLRCGAAHRTALLLERSHAINVPFALCCPFQRGAPIELPVFISARVEEHRHHWRRSIVANRRNERRLAALKIRLGIVLRIMLYAASTSISGCASSHCKH